ncbi:hypothetical protein Q428_13100 [Fervidicella metallireducens AeB]|uniref:HTH merR-type domain-containing protein n=1 Tax=Fervidicella metallireducens AeB TaxID=1403537 RepID=A0A017RSA9_9CLOT|nr:MerR family transcriptional regulator [Fervidicella metallireducens]EYE87476.1 hypothetical protein Q428_13100 [Fervidicella metallireducens AeB]
MFIKDVCRECKLTKKAVEYYEQQGLISPRIENNGYRNYSYEDICILKEISVLRKLDISISDIRYILSSSNKPEAIRKCIYKMDLEIEKSLANKKCLEQLMNDYNIEQTIFYIEEEIEKYFTIREKLIQAFPGPYGMYLCLHFGQFLNGRIDTAQKERAYEDIVNYLDKIQAIEFPKELEEYFQEGLVNFKTEDVQKLNSSIMDFVNNTDKYLEEHKEEIEKYLEFKNSDEYKISPAYKINQMILQFQQENGYYDVFIHNLKILSDSYREYLEKLDIANKAFIDRYLNKNI